MIIKVAYKTIKSYENYKDLKVKHIMLILKKLTRLHEGVMMVKYCKLLIEVHHILMLKFYRAGLLEYKN